RRISHRLPSRTANINTAKIVSIRYLLVHPCFPCLLQPLFDVAWIGWYTAPILSLGLVDVLLKQALGELTQGEPFTERAFISNGLERLAWKPVPRWRLGCGRLRCLRHRDRR